jgi:hypothetical protein
MAGVTKIQLGFGIVTLLVGILMGVNSDLGVGVALVSSIALITTLL